MDYRTSETLWLAPVVPDLVWFGGKDATRFLNDLISQEIGGMQAGDARRSLLLGPQGKLDFILWVVFDGERYGLLTDPGRGKELMTTLGRYRIRVDVTIEEETAPVTVVVGETDGYDVSWAGVARTLVVGDPPDLPSGTVDDYEMLRISSGEPAWEVDVDEGTIPHESGLVPASVDFTKGCYLGQELVARIDSRGGNVPRRLAIVEADEAISAGPLLAGQDDVGRVTSASGSIGLAMVRRGVEDGATIETGGVTVTVRRLPEKTPG